MTAIFIEKQKKDPTGFFYSSSLKLVLHGTLLYNGGCYSSHLEGKVILAFTYYSFNVGYSYSNWDWSDFEFIPFDAFSTLKGYLDFIETADIDRLKDYFSMKEEMVSSHTLFFIQNYGSFVNKADERQKMVKRVLYLNTFDGFQGNDVLKAKLESIGYTFSFDCYGRPTDLRPKTYTMKPLITIKN